MIRCLPSSSYGRTVIRRTVIRRLLRACAATTLCLAVAAAVAFATPADAGFTGTYYLALGDSLSVGVQPRVGAIAGGGHTTRDGYPNQLAAAIDRHDHRVRLTRLGCSGATSTELLHGGRCSYPGVDSQLDAALWDIARRHAPTSLITLDIGINDIMHCMYGPQVDHRCVRHGLAQVRRNLPIILSRLRAAAPDAQIAAMTFYDPQLARYPQRSARPAVRQSVAAFDALNRIIVASCRRTRTTVADVARTYRTDDMTRSASLTGDQLPVAVARICQWTWMCAPPPTGPNLHANRAGYRAMAQTFALALHLQSSWPPTAETA